MSRSVRAPRYDVETIREQQARVQEALVTAPDRSFAAHCEGYGLEWIDEMPQEAPK